MLILGIVLLIIAALINWAAWTLITTLLVVGIGCVVVGLILGERLPKA